jgi:ABC-type nitrate/sulfonate/bicarbonate transport system permease component
MSWHTLDAPIVSLAAAWHLVMSDTVPLPALLRIGAGLVVGGMTGVVVAVLARPEEGEIHAPLQMLRPLPFLLLAPLIVLLSGMPHAPSIALIALSMACPVYCLLFSEKAGFGREERKRVLF